MPDQRSDVAPDGVSTLRHYLQALWRRKWALAAPIVLLPVVVFVASARQDATYEASADVFVNGQAAATTSLIGETPALEDPARTMNTQAQLARVPLVVERTLAATGDPGGSVYVFLNDSAVFPLADVLRFTVMNTDRGQAVDLAGEYARQFVRYKRELDTAGLARAIAQLDAQISALEDDGQTRSAQHLRLTDRRQQLESLVTLRRSNVMVVHTPRPGDEEQVAPRPLRNTAVALAAGVVLGLILAFLWDTLSTKPRSTWEIESLLGMPYLGRIAVAAGAGGEAELPLLTETTGSSADSAHALRTNLDLANAGVRATTIMVASVYGGPRKSATAASLAVAAARSGRRVSLVELDLRNPSLARLFDIDGRTGIASLLRGTSTLDEVAASVRVGAADAPADANRRGWLTVLPAGVSTDHPTETLAAGDVGGALEALSGRSDLVLIDVPALLDAPDAAAVSTHVQGLILVVDAAQARRPRLADARRAIEGWQCVPLGFAIADDRLHGMRMEAWRRTGHPARPRPARAEQTT